MITKRPPPKTGAATANLLVEHYTYYFDDADEVKVIFEVGACGFGDTKILNRNFKNAKIFAFEPRFVPEEKLEPNPVLRSEAKKEIKKIKIRLSKKDGRISSGNINVDAQRAKIREIINSAGDISSSNEVNQLLESLDPKLNKLAATVDPDLNENVEILNMAVSDKKSASETFYIVKGHEGASSLLEPKKEKGVPWTLLKKVEKVEVEVTTINSFGKERGIKNIDLLWMDVQGNELNVLKGMSDYLPNVKMIQTEAGVREYYEGHTLFDEIKKYLLNYGFVTVYNVLEGGRNFEDGVTWEFETDVIFVNASMLSENNKELLNMKIAETESTRLQKLLNAKSKKEE
tara:strand:- start:19 stop:1053 length:1035 start_codon:yes stop_codon:yes gene_type:complete